MNEEYLLSKGWEIAQDITLTQGKRFVEYRCPWELHLKYNTYSLERASQKQEERDYLQTHGVYPKKIRLNDFGWGLWFVIKNNLHGRFIASVEDKDGADRWVEKTKEWLKTHKFKEHSYKQFLAIENIKDNVFNNILIEKLECGDSYYTIPTFRKYIKTLCVLIQRDWPDGHKLEFWNGEPVAPSFGLILDDIPEELHTVANYKIDEYKHNKKEYEEFQHTKTVINRILGLLDKFDENFDEIYLLLRETRYYGNGDYNFYIETLEHLY